MNKAALPSPKPEPAPTVASALDFGREVVEAEARALGRLAETLDPGFADAVGLILATSGRVVVTGLGKSGQIGRKLASTFASTGTPATFVHAAEAGHGDLGMVVAGDSLLVISNSGNTLELVPLIEHARRLDAPILAITGNRHSPRLSAATVVLTTPPVREACPEDMAPTTSSVMALAMGDALAIAAMRLRGTGRGDLQALHPAGTIGVGARSVVSVMHTHGSLPIATPDQEMSAVLLTMNVRGFGIAGVVNDAGTLIGVITDGDLRRHANGLHARRAGDTMTADPIVVTPDATLDVALDRLKRAQITALFVVDALQHRPVGILHIHDLLRVGLS